MRTGDELAGPVSQDAGEIGPGGVSYDVRAGPCDADLPDSEAGGPEMKDLKLQNRLKEARAERKLSQAQLAEMVGVSRNTISSIETGQYCPTAKLALVLCIALDRKFEDLFYFEEG